MSVGQSRAHDAARAHVTGQARYTDDIPTPRGTLHLCFGLSPHAHARVDALDLSAVRSSPGVVEVWASNDLHSNPDVSPVAKDEPLLANGEVLYVGQPVFLVAATSHLAARRAARRADIRYTEQPALLTIEDALAANSRFEEGPRVWSRGDAEAAVASAPHQLEGSIDIGGQEHFYLEGQAALALPQESGDMVVHASTQHPTEIQHKVADALGVAMNAVRVEVRRMGGAFGGKESQGNALAVACALAAQRTGQPCKMRYDRDDDFVITGKRHDFRIDYRVGHDDAGRILGIEIVQYVRCGWAQDLSLAVADRAMLHADNTYQFDDVRIVSHRLKTHTQSATAFRGFGGPQGMLGTERVLDHVAHALGRDPLEVRRLNDYSNAAQPVTPYAMPVEDFILPAMTERLLETSGYVQRRAAVADFNRAETLLKKGIAFSPVKFGISFTLTHLNQAGALVHIYQDGSIHLNHGGTEMGQGLFQKVAQVVASSFGVELERVKITATDTGKVPNTSATAASSGSDLNGMAAEVACRELKARIASVVGGREVSADEAVFEDAQVRVGDFCLAFDEAVTKAYVSRVSLSATGFYKTPKIVWDRIAGEGRPFLYFAYGAAVSEVVIDTLTGENRVLRTDILHDAGRSLNPAIDRGQIEGGYIQGLGWLTTEELVWDASGRLRTHAPSTYKIPACSDRPRAFEVELWGADNPEATIHRSKAVGEPPFMLAISSFLALSDAAAACGPHYPALRAPATPEEVRRAVRRARGEA